jgi:hypothetical protein
LLSAHRLYFYESQGFKHPHDGRGPFIDVTPVASIFLQTWGGFFNLQGEYFHGACEKLTRTKDAGHFSDAKPAPDRVTPLVHDGSPP